MAEQQLVEIARALGAQARVLIMDEPTASLIGPGGRSTSSRVVARAAGGRGRDRLHLAPARGAARDRRPRDRAARRAARRRPARWPRSTAAELIRLMVGREVSAVFPKTAGAASATPVLEAARARLPRGRACSDVSLERARRRDRGPGRARRRGPHRARARPVRPDARRRGRDPARAAEPVAIRSPGRGGRARASPTCPRTAAGTASSSRCRWRPTRRWPCCASCRRRRLPRLRRERRARRRLRASDSGSRPPRSTRRWATSPAATSRRSRSPAGSPPSRPC